MKIQIVFDDGAETVNKPSELTASEKLFLSEAMEIPVDETFVQVTIGHELKEFTLREFIERGLK